MVALSEPGASRGSRYVRLMPVRVLNICGFDRMFSSVSRKLQ